MFDVRNMFWRNWDSSVFTIVLHQLVFRQPSVNIWEDRTLIWKWNSEFCPISGWCSFGCFNSPTFPLQFMLQHSAHDSSKQHHKYICICIERGSEWAGLTIRTLWARVWQEVLHDWGSILSCLMCPPEPEPLPDLLREDPRPALLHGGPLGGGHEDLDGRDRHRGGGIHAVHELRGSVGDKHIVFGRDPPVTDSFDPLPPPRFPAPVDTTPRIHSSFLMAHFLLCRSFHLYIFYISALFCLDRKREPSEGAHTHTLLYINQNVHL